ncbi:hypothetical protein mRhiFer1_008677 [Rhinolophus ferrumequinum]|uniref:Uncharacterized protein n=1 Tax=Rhinolophus ferrumequinum TaxID=59479 RepID=A0A7J7U158_RHIFE|nr:hypothetical protein mRhiFer1_008677 [Rhinolophus ferrumequinum]
MLSLRVIPEVTTDNMFRLTGFTRLLRLCNCCTLADRSQRRCPHCHLVPWWSVRPLPYCFRVLCHDSKLSWARGRGDQERGACSRQARRHSGRQPHTTAARKLGPLENEREGLCWTSTQRTTTSQHKRGTAGATT